MVCGCRREKSAQRQRLTAQRPQHPLFREKTTISIVMLIESDALGAWVRENDYNTRGCMYSHDIIPILRISIRECLVNRS